jgi:hypothetical protein
MMALVWCVAASAAPMPKDKDKDKEKVPEGKNVDSGSFGVYQKGHRVGTETFSIYETGNGSVIHSEFKTEHAPPDVQSSEMQLTAKGDLRRYEWKEASPEQAESVVLPNDEFLIQRWRSGPQGKEQEQPYLLSASTSILDDYSFIQREVLVWKYLAAACKQVNGQMQCPVKQRARFATLNPHERSSASLSAQFLGQEKVTLKSGQRDLLKLELEIEAVTWQLWLDDQFKVVRISIVGEDTEVERD